MEELLLEKTPNTPYVNFNADKGMMKIAGRSIPENPGDFYYQIYDWIKRYFENPKSETKLELQFEYINSGSSKCILEVFRIIKDRVDDRTDFEVNWYYEEEDESMFELGEHYQSITDLPFHLKEF